MIVLNHIYNSSALTLSSNISTQEKLDEFLVELDKHIASSFDVDLSNYKKFSLFTVEKDESMDELAKTYFAIRKDVGDTKPSIYLKGQKEGIIMNQKADGTNKIYNIVLDDSSNWGIKSEDTKKGELMRFKKVDKPNTKAKVFPDEVTGGSLVRYEK